MHVLTDPEGKLARHVLGCPAVDGDSSAVGDTTPVADGKSSFRFHSAARLTQLVHTCEASFGITKATRRIRLALTLGDGAICGKGSIGFVKHEAEVDGDVFSVLREGVCAFHASDNAAAACDRHFAEAMLHDRFLRLVHAGFAWGTGRLILRAVAHEFRRLTAFCVESSDRLVLEAAQADAQGDASRRDRFLSAASRKQAEAKAMERAGWTTWKRPLAPRADSTRKVVWQSGARSRIYGIYGLVYWGILTRMEEARQQAIVSTRAQGREATRMTGMRTTKMKEWRALGRLLLDIRLLVFNCGRSDVRSKHGVSLNLISQSTLAVGSNFHATMAKRHQRSHARQHCCPSSDAGDCSFSRIAPRSATVDLRNGRWDREVSTSSAQ